MLVIAFPLILVVTSLAEAALVAVEALPEREAVIILATKLPLASLFTILLASFKSVASVISALKRS